MESGVRRAKLLGLILCFAEFQTALDIVVQLDRKHNRTQANVGMKGVEHLGGACETRKISLFSGSSDFYGNYPGVGSKFDC